MPVCINKNSIEYQSLKDRAGISEFLLEAVCRDFVEKYGRFPHLDELPNSNSEQHLRDSFQIRKDGGVKVSNILENTGTNTVEDAVISINRSYRDLETQILPIKEYAIVDIQHRPTNNNFEQTEQVIPDAKANSRLILSNAIQKLSTLYGINFHEINDAELNSDQWLDKIPDASAVNAFIYNGEIYINTDRANIDAPVHEILHILIGSMRFENPKLYQDLVNSVESLPQYSQLVQEYPGRTRNDVNEEIFITEMSRFLSGLPSQFMNLDEKAMYEISYNVRRTLDSILMGKDSATTISDDRLYNMTFREVVQELNSSIATSKFRGFINEEGSELHRTLNNIKADLLKNKTLEEICD